MLLSLFFVSACVIGLTYSCLHTSPEMTCFAYPHHESDKPRFRLIQNR